MDIDQKDLTYHYYQAIKFVNDLIDLYFDLLATHHKTDATSCRQVCVIKTKVIEINLLRKSGYGYDSEELFKSCQTILWAALQVYSILHNFAYDSKVITNANEEPQPATELIFQLQDLINTIKYLEAKQGIVHDYEQYFKVNTSNFQTPTANQASQATSTKTPNQQPTQNSNSTTTNNSNQPNQPNNQTNNDNYQSDHPVRMQAKQVEQWLLNHFPTRQEYMDWSFQLKTIQNKLDELEQLIRIKKKPN